jgi:hypothetical protein
MILDENENVSATGSTARPVMGTCIPLAVNTRTRRLLCCCFVVLALPLASAATQGSRPVVKSTTEPEVFAPGVISGGSHDSAPAFSPDGKTVYVSRSNGDLSLIFESHMKKKEAWSPPVSRPIFGTLGRYGTVNVSRWKVLDFRL